MILINKIYMIMYMIFKYNLWNLKHAQITKILLIHAVYLERLFLHLSNHICTYLSIIIEFQHVSVFMFTGFLNVNAKKSDIFNDTSKF